MSNGWFGNNGGGSGEERRREAPTFSLFSRAGLKCSSKRRGVYMRQNTGFYKIGLRKTPIRHFQDYFRRLLLPLPLRALLLERDSFTNLPDLV